MRDAFVTKLNPIGSALIYSTYLGGSGNDEARGIAVDTSGNAYVAGETNSRNFPTTLGAFQTTFQGGFEDAFVTKLNPTGSALVYSTYLGGSGLEDGRGIAVDTSGNAYVTGFTSSPNFPVTPGAFQTVFGGFFDAFVTKLNQTGSALVYSTYFGGSTQDQGFGIAVDTLPIPNAYVTGFAGSTNFPTTAGAFDTSPNGGGDAFVAKIGSSLTGYEIVSHRVLVPASSAANVNVTCSSGNKVLGGGFNIETPAFVPVLSSEPSDGLGNLSDHRWNVFAQNTDPNNARQATVIAVCASATLIAGHEIVSQRVFVPASSAANVNVTCSSGNKVLGGGFNIETALVQVLSEEPSDGLGNLSDHRWNVFVQNTDPNNARQVTVITVCASASLIGHEIVSQRVFVPASSAANVNITCSSGNRVLGGGFNLETAFVQVFSSEPSDGLGNLSDHRWNVLAQNTDPNNARQVTVSAICAQL